MGYNYEDAETPKAADIAECVGDKLDAITEARIAQMRQAELASQVASLRSGYATNAIKPPNPDELARMEARREAEEARYQADRDREHITQARAAALQLAVSVCGGPGDPAAVLDAARDFTAFLTGAEQKAH